MVMEEQAPASTPIISGSVNSRIAGPVMMNSGTMTISVVKEVINDLPKVWEILLSINSSVPPRLEYFRFSRIRSKTTMVSFIEYPTTVRIPAMNGLLTCTWKMA